MAIDEKLIKIYKSIERSLYRKKPISFWSKNWDTAYFQGFESGLDNVLDKMEKEFPELKKIAREE